MHETTVRFSDELWARVRQASRRERISAAEFVREATLTRLAVEQHLSLLRAEVDEALKAFADRIGRLEERLHRHGLR
jgi:predicted nucleotidyltransferase